MQEYIEEKFNQGKGKELAKSQITEVREEGTLRYDYAHLNFRT